MQVVYIPKPKTVSEFGCPSQAEFDTWVPEICGVCCLKMIGDTASRRVRNGTLWELTKECIAAGAFVEREHGLIEGIFYEPLLRIARRYGLQGRSYRYMPLWRLRHLLKRGMAPVLSIDLHKLDSNCEAGHLIVVVGYDKAKHEFIVHDPSAVLGQPGSGVHISHAKLCRLSNRRGMAFSA